MYSSDLDFAISGQRIIWRGKPDKKVFILETIFNSFGLVALIWAALDIIGIVAIFHTAKEAPEVGLVGVPFFLVHLTPVWIYLFGVFTSAIKHKNAEFVVTDRAIYIAGGVLKYEIRMKPFTEITHINIHKGIFDRFLGVGDVVMVCAPEEGELCDIGPTHRHHKAVLPFAIEDIADYQEVFNIIKNLQTDVYADTMYPNAKRPDSNPGYNTKYSRH